MYEWRYDERFTTGRHFIPRTIIQDYGVLFDVFNTLGYGYREKYYQRAIAESFITSGVTFKQEFTLPIRFKDKDIGFGRADFLVEDKIILEIKRGDRISRSDIDQTITDSYIRKDSQIRNPHMFADQKQFFATIEQIASEKGIAKDAILDTIGLAVAAAYKKEYGKRGQIVRAEYNPETKSFKLYQVKLVVDDTMLKAEDDEDGDQDHDAGVERPKRRFGADDEQRYGKSGQDLSGEPRPTGAGEEEDGPRKVRFNPERHIMAADAQEFQPGIQAGEELRTDLPPQDEFGRIAAQTAKQVIIQRIREAERTIIYQEYKAKEGEIVSGTVQRVEGPNVFVDLGRLTALLPPEEQIPGERARIGARVRVLLTSLLETPRGLEARVSRAHPRFVELLFRSEVPEVSQGSVEIKSIAREPGSRSKVAVLSVVDGIDPVGSCVGQRGTRVMTVMNDLGGEKIDIIEYSDDPAVFIAKALSPAKIADVEIDAARMRADVAVPEDQISLAIGRRGQNVRLAAKLTGWRIDIRGAAGEVMGTSDEGTAEEKIPEIETTADVAEETAITAPEVPESNEETATQGEPSRDTKEKSSE
jgi:N utilization substance protein A